MEIIFTREIIKPFNNVHFIRHVSAWLPSLLSHHFPSPEKAEMCPYIIVPFSPLIQTAGARVGGGGMQRVINKNLVKQALSITGIQ